MINKQHFIITSLQSWDIKLGSNAKDIALELSKKNQVLFINISSHIKETKLKKIINNLHVLDISIRLLPVNILPDGIIFDSINYFNNYRIYSVVNKYIKKLGWDEVIHIIDNDIYKSYYSFQFIKSKLTIYYRRDNLSSIKFWQKHIHRLEPELIKSSNIVLCNSDQLMNEVESLNSNSYNIGQGVNYSFFDNAHYSLTPHELKNISTPIIGYVGFLSSWRIDVELIYNLAKNNPDKSFLLIGNKDKEFNTKIFSGLRNVYFLGIKTIQEIPLYINSFDICINPQLLNESTAGNYPRKIDEYLYAGKPVVVTKTKMMESFKDFVCLCEGIEEYQKAIDSILLKKDTINDIKRRKEFASSHNWENSINRIYKLIKENLSDA